MRCTVRDFCDLMPTDKWPQKGESTMQRMRLATLGTVAAFGFALGLVSGLATASAQEKTFNLKLSHWVPPSHPLQKAIQDWADDIKKESNGTINYTIYPAQQLGKAFDHYDMARDGIADFVYVNPGYQPGRFPIIAAGELPFIVGNAKGGNLAIDAWYRKYAATEMKDVHYCFSFVLDPMAWHSSKKKIVVPGGYQGYEGQAGARHHRGLGNAAWRHQCAVERARGAGHSRQGRCRCRSPSRGAQWCCSASTR